MTRSRLRQRLGSKHPCIIVRRSAIHHIQQCAARSDPRETGGILVGYRTDTAIVVVEAVEVCDREAATNRYHRDAKEAQGILDARLKEEPPPSLLGFVGDWHSHPQNVGASSVDLATLRDNALSDGDTQALIVAKRVPEGWAQTGYVANRPSRTWLPTLGRFRGLLEAAIFVGDEDEADEAEWCPGEDTGG